VEAPRHDAGDEETLVTTVCAIGTGPSLSVEQIAIAREKGFRLFGANRVFQVVDDLEVLYGCNKGFWDHYYNEAKSHPCQKWTTNLEAARQYGLNWIGERWGSGLCTDENVIHHGHGSGYSLLGVAHKLGATRIYLLGYDMKYPPGYDGHRKIIGNGKRHFFGEYPPELQHWPKSPWVDLIPLYEEINRQGLVEVISCTPGSALNGPLPYVPIEDA
jgi:hypothetical protein